MWKHVVAGCQLLLFVFGGIAFVHGAPLPRATPESQGVSSQKIREFVEAADQEINSLHSFMVVRHGKVIAEGWWKPESAEKNHILWSLSKSFTSTAIGFAISEDKLSLDDKVLKFFPEDASENLEAMSVRDLLTMSTGHASLPKLRDADANWARTFLAHPVPHQPGSTFLYNTPGSYMLSAIIQKVTGQTTLEYLRPRLWEPLGIEDPVWETSPDGVSLGGYGLYVRTEDIAKFGQLYLQKGEWNGKQLLPAEWVEMATSKQVENHEAPSGRNPDWREGYGFQFWRCRHGVYRGDGKDGQFCVVMPKYDAVVVMTAKSGNLQGQLDLVWKHLLPAFHDETLPENKTEQERLQDVVSQLELPKETTLLQPQALEGRQNVAREVDLPEPAIPGLRYYYPPEKVEPREIETDVCIYGGTCAGVVAAVQADRMGKRVVLLEFGKHLGGLSSGGLSHTDGGDAGVCGGIAREFYNIIGQRNFRPSEAEAGFEKLLEGTDVVVHKLAHLDIVEKDSPRIVSITMEDGLKVRAKQFIDTTYEGDLLARAGVSWHAGREANSVYDETYNGIRVPGTGGHNWPTKVDPYRVSGDPSSGLLPRVNDDPGTPGEGDDRIQAFCFRMWLTKNDPMPFPKPAVYDLDQYELLARLFESGANPRLGWSLDTNNHHLFAGAYFIDFVGGNYDWPDASWVEREKIFQDHANYQIGVMHFLATSDRIPEPYRSEIRKWGLPKDEYEDTSGWTHQLYIREGRRMVSDYVMTQNNCQGVEVPEDSVGLASYNMDSHHCQMTVVDGAVRNEGNVEIPVEPYPISYRALTPKPNECTNLLVPVALSSTHIAFGSIRMEPVFMLLGQSAATASAIAIDDEVAVQEVEYPKLRERLLKDGQILEYTGPPRHRRRAGIPVSAKSLEGYVVDNEQAELTGPWSTNDVTHPRVGATYVHDNNENKGECLATYRFEVDEPGQYEIRVSWPPNPNRATNVPITIRFDGQETAKTVDQKESGEQGLNSIGVFELKGAVEVEISNAKTNGYVIADAVQVRPYDPKADEKNPRKEEGQPQSMIEKLDIAPAAADAPNILVLFADDLGYEALGCYGGKSYETPHLDQFATQGMRFSRAYTSPVCTPSRMSLYTGTYATTHRYDNVLPVHRGTKQAVDFRSRWLTYAQVLREAGYQTSVTGKWQLAALEFHQEHCRDAGFDSWCVWQIWRDGAKTTRYWNPCFNHDGKIREDIADKYGPDVLAKYVINQMKTAKESGKPFCIHHNMLLPHWPILETPDEKQSGKPAAVGHMISYMDTLCGRILKAVDDLGLAKDTVVIFMGDNGTDVAEPRETERGLVRGGKTDFNDAGTHIPLIVRWPGKIDAGSVAEDLVDMADLFPTICELAGISLPDGVKIDGQSFATRLINGESFNREWVSAGYHGDASLFDGAWRVVLKSGKVIDARHLPEEQVVNDSEVPAQVRKLRSSLSVLNEQAL